MAKRTAVKQVAGTGSKGDRTRRAIIEAVNDIVAREGMTAVSQENVARRVGISQSALRHHYPTKDNLVRAVVDDQLVMFRTAMERLMLEPGGTPASRLARMIDAHFERVTTHSEALTFEVYAHWARDAEARKPAHEWFAWLASHYAELIRLIRPTLSRVECGERALQIITLCLGAWITLAETRPLVTDRAAGKVRRGLQRGVDSLVGAALPWQT
jgi:AcrR family transcriptional regulator